MSVIVTAATPPGTGMLPDPPQDAAVVGGHVDEPDKGRHQQATAEAVEANRSHLRFAVGGVDVDVSLPPVDRLAFYAGLTGFALLGVIEWPIAALTAVGHALADDRSNRKLHALGVALDAV